MKGRPLPLRTTLLVAYGLAISLVLGAFGAVAQAFYWQSLIRDLDADLQARAVAIARSIGLDDDGQFEILMPPDVRTFLVGQPDVYYVVRRADGTEIDFTVEDLDIPPLAPGAARSRGDRREIAVAGELDTTVVIGRRLDEQAARYAGFSRALVVAGAAGVVVALLSGWIVIRRVLAPIARIGRTAEMMSASNLNLRIDVGGTESELSEVARALNGAFDRLQAAFERQARFTADASHELRTPLSTVVSEAEWALRRGRTGDDYRRAFEVCLRAAHRMRALVDQLLSLARADAAATETRQPVDLAVLAGDAVAELATRAAAHDVRIETALQPAPAVGDPLRLREAIANLVVNAIDYNRAGGFVRVEAGTQEGIAAVHVRDNGIGIAATDAAHVFERFYRADAARSRSAGGAGLGLAIAQEIILGHGGRLHCRSTFGEGSHFVLELPAGAPAVAAMNGERRFGAGRRESSTG